MINLNLLPPTEKETLRLNQAQRWVIFYGSAVLCSLVILLFSLSAIWLFIFFQSQNSGSAPNTAGLGGLSNQEIKEHPDQVAKLNADLAEISKFQKQHRYYSAALMHLSGLIPSGVRLNELTLDDKNLLTLAGYAAKRDDLLRLKASLEKSDFFTGLNNPLSNLIRQDDINFSFTLTIKSEKLLKP